MKFKNNCGVSKSDLDRGFTEGMQEKKIPSDDVLFSCRIKDQEDYLGDGDAPEFKPGFLGRSPGRER